MHDTSHFSNSVLSPRDEPTLVRKVQINPRTTAKDLVKMLEETGTKLSTVPCSASKVFIGYFKLF